MWKYWWNLRAVLRLPREVGLIKGSPHAFTGARTVPWVVTARMLRL
jgi:hypothetical protein